VVETECISLEDLEKRLENRPRIKKIYFVLKYQFLGIVNFPHHIKRIKWFIQRGQRGYADCDWWNMNAYLIRIILPMLREMRSSSIGYPGWGEASTPKKWNNILELYRLVFIPKIFHRLF